MKNISFSDFITMSVNTAWKTHLRKRHYGKSPEDLITRVRDGYYDRRTGYYNQVHMASTFLGPESCVVSFLTYTLLSREDDIFSWLKEGNTDTFEIRAALPKRSVQGVVYDGSFHRGDHALVVLERVYDVFRIKTSYVKFSHKR